jgi:hypothetical protein
MKDQVDNLRNKTGAPNAAALSGMLTAPERGEVLQGIQTAILRCCMCRRSSCAT